MNKAMLDELTADCKTPQDVERLYSQMLQHMINRSLEAEMQVHLGHARHGASSGNPGARGLWGHVLFCNIRPIA